MKRRDFTQLSALTTLGLLLPLHACKQREAKAIIAVNNKSQYETLVLDLLTEWCDAMILMQVNEPENPALHGALFCNACNRIHGRCMDAVYPFLYMADRTGEDKYLNAAIKVMNWSENVSKADGSWTVVPDPKSWSGITIFGAIALGEALHHHGHILPEEIRYQWTERLKNAAEFVHQNFDLGYSHINYAMTAVYGLNMFGRMFNNQAYLDHSKKLAAELPARLTQPNQFIFGENNPADKPSASGLFPVDLGYNVEETLNGLVQYAIVEQDEALLELLKSSMESHLEFMLPDGAWDNSWGTRQNKWSYWGSRTTDGCQPAFTLMAHYNPAFGTAAYLNTELLKRCTVDGLLAGGLHYESHNILPCLHHTFTHAKSMAFVLDNTNSIPTISKETPLPRSSIYGIKYFSDLNVWLVAKGPWKATISANDVIFKKPHSQSATGGALAVLWHEKTGPLFTASMAEYIMVEPYNQQPQPDGEDIPLTPRIETEYLGKWYSNLFDLKAKVETTDGNGKIIIKVTTQLTDRDREVLPNSLYQISYLIDEKKMEISIKCLNPESNQFPASLMLPLISPRNEKVTQVSDRSIEVHKEKAKVVITSNAPITITKTEKERVFNMVPGMQAIPVKINLDYSIHQITTCSLEVIYLG